MKTTLSILLMICLLPFMAISQPNTQTEDDMDLNDVLKAKISAVINNGDFGSNTSEMRTKLKAAYEAYEYRRGLNDSSPYIRKFRSLENAILSGKGQSILSVKSVKRARRAHPGMQLYHFKLRFRDIVTRMESETEDE